MFGKLKTLFWGVLAPLAILLKGGFFPYTLFVIILALIYVDWLKRKDMTTQLLSIQAILAVSFILVSSSILLLGGAVVLLS